MTVNQKTWTAISTFLLEMVLHPECQKIGQAEVDRVVGRDRPHTFEDRGSLPYVDCVIQEVLRYVPSFVPVYLYPQFLTPTFLSLGGIP